MLRLALRGDRLDLRFLERNSRQGGNFARDTEDRQAIGAVGSELQRQHVLVEPKRRAHIASELRILRQLEQPGMVFGQSQLARRAEHSLTAYAAHLSRRDLEVA